MLMFVVCGIGALRWFRKWMVDIGTSLSKDGCGMVVERLFGGVRKSSDASETRLLPPTTLRAESDHGQVGPSLALALPGM